LSGFRRDEFLRDKSTFSKLKQVADFPLSFKTLLGLFLLLLNAVQSDTIRGKTPERPGAAQNRRPEGHAAVAQQTKAAKTD
jgi:hypothetical protein